MTADEADSYVGLPYKEGSYGPDNFNCWGLLYHVQRTYFNVDMPIAPIGDPDRLRHMFSDRLNAAVWAQVEKPEHGDGALMRSGDNPHVGVYLDIDGGGILHALEGVGVVFTTLDQLNIIGFARTKYYRLTNECNFSSS